MRVMHVRDCAFAVLIAAVVQNQAEAALSLQLKASNYNPTTGVWTDSSSNNDNATYSGSSIPSLVANATPDGASAVSLTGAGSLLLASSIADSGSGYTVFAFMVPVSGAGRNALTGGSSPGALEWDIYNHNDDYLREYQADVAHGTTTIPTSSFSLVDLAVNSSGSSFDFNSSPDGTGAGASFTSAITRIGNNEGGGDGFVGQIAEIDVYSGVLTPTQIAAVESQVTSAYVPEPTSLALLATGSLGLLRRRPRVD